MELFKQRYIYPNFCFHSLVNTFGRTIVYLCRPKVAYRLPCSC